ncbi:MULTISPECIES: aromatic amino acid transport family protein [Vibrio]|uniref:Serine transporter n=2 Tax=Vibrio TaxID=662 RepID=U3A3S4_VIBPR|nr:aromatic amino acid transport family protein [Vibrio proteolyticus]NAW58542.1 HAAAP family serine/threonine permease [Vibrio sp. V36_P2S2PM302]NAX24243.1 HAAAP family serine/threonine permease [Vibrio sp. V38_P2S17PM301]NAX28455.1 HAAAP family serine/threonine permease [Vibrio sp. V37_P2S8PM304]GAD68330.1 serine transporter [Vibrio proteolyticus NBRC 13287]
MKQTIELSKNSDLSAGATWTRHDTHWVLSLFGTAVGAGILFLPINLGIGGFWPLMIMAVLAFPMTFLAHRGLARFVLSSQNKQSDFTDVVEEHFGAQAGRLISLLYFLSIFPILLIYGVGLTNTVESFLINQAGMASPPRVLLSGVLVFTMIAIMMGGEKLMLRAFAAMVYPLVAILGFLSLYLIPNWQMPSLDMPNIANFSQTLWLAVPVVIFSFSHAAAISSFVGVQRRHYDDQATVKSEQILKRTSIMLIAFVLLFVFSCVLTLSPQQLAEAKQQNVSVLSYLANVTHNPFIATLGPLVAFIAITSSFLGHFLGARESLNGLVTKHSDLSYSQADKLGVVAMFFAIWFAAVMNPSILGMMEALSGPVIAMILFIMPMIAVYKVDSLKAYRGRLSTYFILLAGALAISALLFSLID